jgi:hypothetical protein
LQLAVVDTSPHYLTEGSGALSGFGGPELRIVEGIEGFRAEIEMVPFERQWEAPVDGESEWIRLPALPVLLDCEARCVVADSLCEGKPFLEIIFCHQLQLSVIQRCRRDLPEGAR